METAEDDDERAYVRCARLHFQLSAAFLVVAALNVISTPKC